MLQLHPTQLRACQRPGENDQHELQHFTEEAAWKACSKLEKYQYKGIHFSQGILSSYALCARNF